MNASVRARALALMPPAALVVHELRFALGSGGARAGHGYLELAAPVAGLLGALVAAEVVSRLADADAPTAATPPRRWARVWLAVAVGLLTVYAGQELLEAALCDCRAGGLSAVLGAGGWTAVPAALVVAGLLALGLRGAAAALALAAARRLRRRRVPARPLRPSAAAAPARLAPLASAAAGRAPPSLAAST